MFAALSVRLGLVGVMSLAVLSVATLPARAVDTGVPPHVDQCYTLTTNPPVGPYDPEATLCRPI